MMRSSQARAPVPRDQEFCEILHLIDANAAAHGLDLAPHRIAGVGAAERGGFKIGSPVWAK